MPNVCVFVCVSVLQIWSGERHLYTHVTSFFKRSIHTRNIHDMPKAFCGSLISFSHIYFIEYLMSVFNNTYTCTYALAQ